MSGKKKLALVGLAFTLIAVPAFTLAQLDDTDLAGMREVISARFPDVVWVDADRTARMMRLPEARRPLLVDTREPAEFAVSHLEGARWLDPDEPDFSTLPTPGELGDRHVIVYCSVGYRSAAITKKLVERGYRACNLERGLFGWANEERPMVGAEPTKVHPYDATWGRMVRPEVRAALDE